MPRRHSTTPSLSKHAMPAQPLHAKVWRRSTECGRCWTISPLACHHSVFRCSISRAIVGRSTTEVADALGLTPGKCVSTSSHEAQRARPV